MNFLRKFLSLFKFDGKGDSEIYGNRQEKVQQFREYKEAQKQQEPLPAVEINFATGQIILPENMSPEDRAEIESAVKELKNALSVPGTYDSLEAFIKENSSSHVVPFTVANDLPDNQLQVLEEMENHRDDTEHWSELDYIEHLLGFHNQGYEFEGLEEMYTKVHEKLDLSDEELKKLKAWYILVSQELVYNV